MLYFLFSHILQYISVPHFKIAVFFCFVTILETVIFSLFDAEIVFL